MNIIEKICNKVKKKYVKPKIERIAIYTESRGYMGMSKQMQSLHRSQIKHEKCLRKCENK